jgi:hypothetical protein
MSRKSAKKQEQYIETMSNPKILRVQSTPRITLLNELGILALQTQNQQIALLKSTTFSNERLQQKWTNPLKAMSEFDYTL